MKRLHIAYLLLLMLFGVGAVQAQTCFDRTEYPVYKNVGATGGITIQNGQQEWVGQTYRLSNPGLLSSVRTSLRNPSLLPIFSQVRVRLYAADAAGRPTGPALGTTGSRFVFPSGSYADYTFNFPSPIAVSSDFAVVVEWVNGVECLVGYNGDGEGRGEDLASIAGTSTGFNWVSLKNTFSHDGDFYIFPRIDLTNSPSFTASSTCISTGGTVNFTNTSVLVTDSMFNRIGLSGYSGTEEYYTWNFGDGSPVSNTTSPSHTYASAGVYTVTLTSTIVTYTGYACTRTSTMEVSVGLAVSTSGLTNVSCNGGSNGAITLSGSGGKSPYTFSINGGVTWSAAGSSASYTGLTAGSYTGIVRDALGCENTVSFTITEPTAISATTVITAAGCGLSNGTIAVTASGGVSPYMYAIDGGAFGATPTFTGVSAGGHTITVRDANMCEYSFNVVVNTTSGPSIVLSPYTNITCYGGNDGTIGPIIATGGTGTLQYSLDGGAYSTTNSWSALFAGSHTVFVRDGLGCTTGIVLNLTQPNDSLVIVAEAYAVSCNGDDDGEISVTYAAGGTGALQFSINGTTYQTSPDFDGLTAGTYTVYVRDIGNCVATTTVTITQPAPLVATITGTTTNTCFDGSDGTVSFTASGGTAPYSYSLDNISFFSVTSFNSLAAGSYTLYVIDDNGCETSAAFTITQPSQITATFSTTTATCGASNGGILITATGGTGTKQYSIDGGATWNTTGSFTSLAGGTYFILVKDANNCQEVFSVTVNNAGGPVLTLVNKTDVSCYGRNDGQIVVSATGGTGSYQFSKDGITFVTSGTFTGLAAGTYTIIVRDAVGCVSSIDVTINQPTPFTINPVVVDNVCFGGTTGQVTVTAAGGIGILQYSLSGGTYQLSNIFGGLTAGSYTVTVKDASGCDSTVSFVVNEPDQINIFVTGNNITCYDDHDGMIIINATGGTGSKQYSIDGTNYFVSGTFSLLAPGSYVAYAKDANGCVVTDTLELTEPDALIAAVDTVINVRCAGGNDGEIILSGNGGTAPYTYMWSTSDTTSSISGLVDGSYTVTITDFNGCTITETYTITAPVLPLILNGTVTDASSCAVADGAIDITMVGGTPAYSFSWTGPSFTATTEDITGLLAGNYTVEVTDAVGCITTQTFTVNCVVGVDNDLVNSGVQVFPNPASTVLNIKVGSYNLNSVKVVDVVGHVVFESDVNGHEFVLNTAAFTQGYYVLHLNVDGVQVMRKLEIVK